jgi:hypothetical protein
MKQFSANQNLAYKAKVGASIALIAFICLVLGAAVPLLPLQLSAALSALIVGPLFFVFLWKLPPITSKQGNLLRNLLFASLFIYFVWPRNAFIPISALPVKHPQKIAYLFTLCFWAFLLAKSSHLRLRLSEVLGRNKTLIALVLGLIAWTLGAVVNSMEPAYSLVKWTQDILTIWILVPVLLTAVESEEDVKLLVTLLIAAAAINVIYAIPEVAFKRNIFESFITLDEIDPEMAKQIIGAKIRGGEQRAQASFDHPILFAEYLALMLPYVLAGFSSKRFKGFTIASLPLLLVGLVLSRSRVAFVATTAVLLVFFGLLLVRSVTNSKKSAWPLVGTLLAVPLIAAVVLVSLAGVSESVQGSSAAEASSTNSRQLMLVAGWDLLQDSIAFGFGPGVGAAHLNFRSGNGVVTLDNYLLILALDSGLIATVLFALIVLVVIYKNVKAAFFDNENYPLYFATAASAVAFLAVKAVLGTGLNNLLLAVFVVLAMMPMKKQGQAATNKSGV